MKIIKLNEDQLNRLIETANTSAQGFNNGDVKEYQGSEISTSANISSPEGNIEYGKPIDTDDIQKQLAIQNFWANGRAGTRPI